jgi:hypothetical protein
MAQHMPRSSRRPVATQLIKRTPDATSALIQDMRIDHRRADISMAKEFLNGPDVVPGFEQMCRKRMPE